MPRLPSERPTRRGVASSRTRWRLWGWYRRAAKQGNSRAQVLLGMTYIGGGAILADYVLAHMWFNIASAKGHQDVGIMRDWLETKMTRPQILRAVELARTCMESNYHACEPH